MMRYARWAAAAAAVLACGFHPALAQQSDGHCSGAAFTDQLGIARIAKSRGKVNFIRGIHDDKSCPRLAEACRDRAFLVAGDVVLTSEQHGDFVCATFVNARAIETIGWLPATALEKVPAASIALTAWHGTWKRIEAEIRIKPAAGGALAVEGTATWGSYDKARVARGAVQNGEISATTQPKGDVLFFADAPADTFENAPSTDCAIRMRRIAQYLVVEDNKSCGGANVSFSGIYVRR